MCIDITEYVCHIFSLYHTFMILLFFAKFDLDSFFGHPREETLLQTKKQMQPFSFCQGSWMIHNICWMETEELMFSQ